MEVLLQRPLALATRGVRGLALAVVASSLLGCPPRIPPATPLTEAVREPVSVERVEDASATVPRVELLWLTGGSRWDPPGHEGRAWASLHTLRLDPRTRVVVGRDHAWVQILCTPPGPLPRPCTAPLTRAMLGPPADATEAAQRALHAPTPRALTETLVDGLLHPAHPYGHPVAGRLGVLGLHPATLPAWSRSTVHARVIAADPDVVEPLAAQVEAELARLPPTLPPDPAMKAPAPTGPLGATVPVPGDRGFVGVGLALPRRPTETTRLLPDDDLVLLVEDLHTCLADALPGLTLVTPDEAPPGWDPRLTIRVHPSLRWVGPSPDGAPPPDLLRRLRSLPDAIDATCAKDPDRSREALTGALQAGYVVVLAHPEDLAPPRVEGLSLTPLPAPGRGLLR